MNSTTTIPWDRAEPFIYTTSATIHDIDSYQHVNNSVYIRWLDECARAHSKSLGVDTDSAKELGYGMAVRESQVTYLAAAYSGDAVMVGTWLIENDGKLRAKRQFHIIRASDNTTIVRAVLEYVYFNIETGRPCKMPALFRERYAISSPESSMPKR